MLHTCAYHVDCTNIYSILFHENPKKTITLESSKRLRLNSSIRASTLKFGFFFAHFLRCGFSLVRGRLLSFPGIMLHTCDLVD